MSLPIAAHRSGLPRFRRHPKKQVLVNYIAIKKQLLLQKNNVMEHDQLPREMRGKYTRRLRGPPHQTLHHRHIESSSVKLTHSEDHILIKRKDTN